MSGVRPEKHVRMFRALTLASRAAHEAAVSLSFGLTHGEMATRPAISVANEAALHRIDNGAKVPGDAQQEAHRKAAAQHYATLNAHLQDFFIHANAIQSLLNPGGGGPQD